MDGEQVNRATVESQLEESLKTAAQHAEERDFARLEIEETKEHLDELERQLASKTSELEQTSQRCEAALEKATEAENKQKEANDRAADADALGKGQRTSPAG